MVFTHWLDEWTPVTSNKGCQLHLFIPCTYVLFTHWLDEWTPVTLNRGYFALAVSCIYMRITHWLEGRPLVTLMSLMSSCETLVRQVGPL